MATMTKTEGAAGRLPASDYAYVSDATADLLQEYADNRGIALKIDRQRSVIPGVKVLGSVSAMGREYPPAVIQRAIPLHESRVVNVDVTTKAFTRKRRDGSPKPPQAKRQPRANFLLGFSAQKNAPLPGRATGLPHKPKAQKATD
jgi:hypothetical protein